MGTEMVSEKIVVSTEPPENGNARVRFVVGSKAKASFEVDRVEDLFIQTDRSRLQFEWYGFEDVSGIDHYDFRLMCRNETLVGWKDSGKHTMVNLKDLDLRSGSQYMVEVRAVNSGHLTSFPVVSYVNVESNEPTLTGKPVAVSRNGRTFRFDWSEVFYLQDVLTETYDVSIGSKQGYTDILQLQRISVNVYDVIVPTATIISQNVQEMFIAITCTYSTGIYTVYQSTYKI